MLASLMNVLFLLWSLQMVIVDAYFSCGPGRGAVMRDLTATSCRPYCLKTLTLRLSIRRHIIPLCAYSLVGSGLVARLSYFRS